MVSDIPAGDWKEDNLFYSVYSKASLAKSYHPDSRGGLSHTACVKGWKGGCPRKAPRWDRGDPPSAAGRSGSAPANRDLKRQLQKLLSKINIL